MSADAGPRQFLARMIRRFAVPIILFWLAVTALLNLTVPQLEVIGRKHAVALNTKEAPSTQAMKRIGEVFHEYHSDNVAMLVLEGDKPLGADAHRYYDQLIGGLSRDKKDVQHIQSLWADPVTAAGVQSRDGKAAYVQLNLAGDQGGTAANEALQGAREVVSRTPPPPGVKAYVTGSGALSADLLDAGDKSMVLMTSISIVVIAIMMFIVYRTVSTVLILLALMGVGVGAARGLISLLADRNVLGLTFFATNLLTTLAIAAGTDYGIFFIGRYQEARQAGEDPETAYYTTFRSVAPIVL
ncbi:MAG: MMPL family transporter, partial [Mycobacterium sp.]|nr:MMPL family transporter [Mycobacterium sp.]